MTITYDWNVTQLSCYPEHQGEQDVVVIVNWTLNGEDSFNGTRYTGYAFGSVNVEISPEEPFTPYADLTLDQVIGWVKNVLGAEKVAEYEASVANQIQNQINPPIVTPPLPWFNAQGAA